MNRQATTPRRAGTSRPHPSPAPFPLGARPVLRVGTFLPPALSHGGVPPGARAEAGRIPAGEQALLRELLAGLTGVEFVHDLDIRRSCIRNGRVHCGEVCLHDLDLYVWHAEIARDPGGYTQEALRTLSLDVPVVPDPERFATCLDKYRAHLALSRAGLPVPDTLLVGHHNTEAAAPVLAEWGRALLKPRLGSYGQGVLLVEDFATLRDLVGFLDHEVAARSDGTLLLERICPSSGPGDWLGTTLLDGRLMYGYRKRTHRFTRLSTDVWKVYDPRGAGGDVDGCDVPPAHARLVRRAQRILGLPLVGFDLIVSEGRPVIVDENTFPGLYPDLFAATGRSLGHELCAFVAGVVGDLGGRRPERARAPGNPDVPTLAR
ncbi:RimK family alpha-L-glutamate ligase [Streptomyces sp. NPDC058735]|uniref:ATP-grasp domain-containing protein n=1 Tax=unclassified Streptomyces TaxID=2593676 RepID=UPI0036791A0D